MIKVILVNVFALCVYVFVLNNIWEVMPAEISLAGKLLSFGLIFMSPLIAYKLYKRNSEY